MKKYIILGILITVIIYLAGCLVSADFSITYWSSELRGIMATVWMVALGVIIGNVAITEQINKEDRQEREHKKY